MRKLALLLVWMLLGLANAYYYDNGMMYQMPGKWLVYNKEAEIMLGVTLPLTKVLENSTCAVLEQSDLQILESLLYALDYVKDRSDLYPFKLGAVILDSCDNPKIAVQNTIKLVMPILLQQLGPYYYDCPDNGSVITKNLGEGMPWQIAGMIGSETSDDCIQMTSVIQMAQIPQISHLATSPELSDLNKYPFFMRTVPSDKSTVKAIIELLKRFEWTYISAVYDDSLYSLEGYSLFEDEARMQGICFATSEKIQLGNSALNQTLQKLELAAASANATVVVVFASYEGSKMFFRHVCDSGKADQFVWIGVDSWVGRGTLSINDNCDVFQHSLGVAMRMQKLDGFEDRFKDYRPSKCTKVNCNPWMAEYFERNCDCTYKNNSSNSLPHCNDVEEDCATNKLYLSFEQDAYVSYMTKAVLAYAEALSVLYDSYNCTRPRNLTSSADLICEAMMADKLVENDSGINLTQILRNISFLDLNNETFRFLDEIDGLPYFSIYAFVNDSWHIVGDFTGSEASPNNTDLLTFTPYFIEHKLDTLRSISSRCSSECKAHEAKSYPNPLELCCWTCTECPDNNYIVRGNGYEYTRNLYAMDDTENDIDDYCVPCPERQYTNATFDGCDPYYDNTISASHWYWALLVGTACLGFCVTFAVFFVFWKYRNTPLILAADQASSFLVLFACASAFCATFIIMSPPSDFTCSSIRIAIGITETLLYATIFAKTLRIMCIFMEDPVKPFTLLRHRYALAYVILGLLGLEMVILIAWMTFSSASYTLEYKDSHKTVEAICSGIGIEFLMAFALPIVLAFLSMIIAFKIRKIPDGFNEQKGLSFVVYTNSLLLFSFVLPLTSGMLNYHLQIVSLSLQGQLNAVVVLLGLFAPKIYIVLFRPEKNTKQAIMNRTRTFSSKDKPSLNVISNDYDNCESTRSSEIGRSFISDSQQSISQAESVNNTKVNRVSFCDAQEIVAQPTKDDMAKTSTEKPRVRFSLLDVRALSNCVDQDADEPSLKSGSVIITELDIDPDSGCVVSLTPPGKSELEAADNDSNVKD